MTSESPVVLRFAAFELDRKRHELRRDGAPVRLAPQPFRLLVELATHPGELLTRKRLQEALWDGGRFVDAEAGLNFAVRQLRRALDDSGRQPRWIETVPRLGYRFLATVEAADPAAAAALDSTPAFAAPLPVAIGSDRAAPDPPSRRAVQAAAAVLFALVAGFAFLRADPSGPELPAVRVAAIEVDPGGARDLLPVARALDDDLASSLIRDLGSRARVLRSGRPAAGDDADLVVSGRLLPHPWGGRLTVRVERAGRLVWSLERADAVETLRFLEPALAEGVARAAADAASAGARRRASAGEPGPEAIAACDEGRARLERPERDLWSRSGESFERATRLAPGFAPAWEGLARAQLLRATTDRAGRREAIAAGRSAVDRALALAESADARASLAGLELLEFRRREARAAIDRALALEPRSAYVLRWLLRVRLAEGDVGGAVAAAKEAVAADPLALWSRADLAWTLLLAGRLGESLTASELAVRLEPGSNQAWRSRYLAFLESGESRAAAFALDRLIEVENPAGPDLRALPPIESREELRAEMLAELEGRSRRRPPLADPLGRAGIAALLGERERALALLDEAWSERSPALVYLPVIPWFRALGDDARYRDLLRRVAAAPAARAS